MFRKNRLLFIIIFIITTSIKAQTREANDTTIAIDISITIDDIAISDTSYILNVINLKTDYITAIKVSANFIMFLDINTKFEVSVMHPTTNCKTIIIDTHAPKGKWNIVTGFGLKKSENKEKIFVGSIIYDEKLKTFKKIK